MTRLPLTSTPPVLSVTRTGPTIVFGSQPVAADEHGAGAAADRERPGDRRAADPHGGRAVRDDRPGDPAALDVERAARRDRHRPGLAPAGADADRLARGDVQRPRAAARSGTAASSSP